MFVGQIEEKEEVKKKTIFFFFSPHWLYDYTVNIGPCEMNYLKVNNNISKNCVPLKDLPSPLFIFLDVKNRYFCEWHTPHVCCMVVRVNENGAQGRLYMNDYFVRII